MRTPYTALPLQVKSETPNIDFEKLGQQITRRQVLEKVTRSPPADGQPAPSASPLKVGAPRKLLSSLPKALRADLRLNQHAGSVACLTNARVRPRDDQTGRG